MARLAGAEKKKTCHSPQRMAGGTMTFLYVLIKQPVLRAAPEQPPVGKKGKPGFQPPLRVQLFHHDRISREKGQKGDVVLPAHFMP